MEYFWLFTHEEFTESGLHFSPLKPMFIEADPVDDSSGKRFEAFYGQCKAKSKCLQWCQQWGKSSTNLSGSPDRDPSSFFWRKIGCESFKVKSDDLTLTQQCSGWQGKAIHWDHHQVHGNFSFRSVKKSAFARNCGGSGYKLLGNFCMQYFF